MAEFTIVVSDRTKVAKSFIQMALNLSKKSKYIRVFDENSEDKALASLMKKSLKSKKVSREAIFKTLE